MFDIAGMKRNIHSISLFIFRQYHQFSVVLSVSRFKYLKYIVKASNHHHTRQIGKHIFLEVWCCRTFQTIPNWLIISILQICCIRVQTKSIPSGTPVPPLLIIQNNIKNSLSMYKWI